MTRELSTEWSSRGVRVNSILPAQVVNPSLEKRMAADPTLEDQWLRGIPVGRLGKPTTFKGSPCCWPPMHRRGSRERSFPMDGGNLAVNAGARLRHQIMPRLQL